MKWVVLVVIIPIILIIWRLLEDRDRARERQELVDAIRKELLEVRNDILKEIRSK
jgi:inner membrane protein involved in colicin E2 resistance